MLSHVPRPEARAAMLSLSAGIVLTGMKFAAYFLSDSAAVFSDALESIVNVAAAAFATYALSLAHRPADAEHPYGHGKIEFLSATFEGGMILLAGVVSAVRAVEGFIHPDLHVSRIGLTLGLMLTTLVINGWLGFHLISTGKRHTSATLEADGWHLLADAVTSLAACAALVIVWWTHWNYADPIAALAVAVYIGRIGVKLLTQSSAGLMDRQDVEDDRLLHEILTAHVGPDGREPRICSFHKLRHRHSGRYHWVDFHIMVPARWDIRRGHEVASSIEYEIEQALGEGNATAHVEPCGDEACASCAAAEPEDEKLKSFSPAG